MPVNTRLQVRRGSGELWSQVNPTDLYAGEIGYETNTGKIKIGDSQQDWNSLKYVSVPLNSGNYISYSGIDGSGVNIDFDASQGYATWSVDTDWLENFIANSSGALNAEGVQDIIGSGAGNGGFLVNGTGVAWSYDDPNNQLAVSVTGIPHDLITDWDAALSGNIDTQLIAGTGITFVYDSGNNTLTISTAVLDDTHTHIWDNITDAKTKATLTELGYLSGVVPGTASADRALVVDSNKDITGINDITTVGDVFVGGDLTVAGTSTVVNSTVVNIGDNIIAVNTSGLPTGGLEVRNSGTSDYKQFVWDNVDARWEVGSENLQANRFVSTVSSPTAPIEVASTGLVTNLNADLLDGEHGSYYLDWGNFSGLPSPVITVSLSGDVVGSDNLTWTNLNGNVTLSLNTVIQPDSVALSGDTTGDYVESVNVAGTGLSIDVTSGEAQKPTITSNATPANSGNTIVSRDANGSFSAEVINAAGLSGTSTADPVYITYAIIDGGSP